MSGLITSQLNVPLTTCLLVAHRGGRFAAGESRLNLGISVQLFHSLLKNFLGLEDYLVEMSLCKDRTLLRRADCTLHGLTLLVGVVGYSPPV